tara:strand:+ start:64 stop:309 length:246 start_codon:yes stop_codon:yes gene_type:complete
VGRGLIHKGGAKIGNKNALNTKWYIIKSNNNIDSKIQYQVSNNVIDLRTKHYDFDVFEDAQKFLEQIKTAVKSGKEIEEIK